MYVISPITVFDDEKELFETHIGLDDEAKTLLLSAWGKTEHESRMLAKGIIARLSLPLSDDIRAIQNLRKNPLTIEECTPIIGEGPESAEEL